MPVAAVEPDTETDDLQARNRMVEVLDRLEVVDIELCKIDSMMLSIPHKGLQDPLMALRDTSDRLRFEARRWGIAVKPSRHEIATKERLEGVEREIAGNDN
jgi:hypothetical protein